jgi:RNA polymerase sigma-70 factor (ECF subfamily)
MLTADEAAVLIEAIAIRQDRAAFAALYRHYAPRVRAFLMRGGADADSAQEIAQEALIMVWRKAASFDRARASAATWLYPSRATSGSTCCGAPAGRRSRPGC